METIGPNPRLKEHMSKEQARPSFAVLVPAGMGSGDLPLHPIIAGYGLVHIFANGAKKPATVSGPAGERRTGTVWTTSLQKAAVERRGMWAIDRTFC